MKGKLLKDYGFLPRASIFGWVEANHWKIKENPKMPFEEFTKNRPIKDTPTISILKQGLIGISQVCYNKYFKNYEYIILMFDKENKVIGLKPTNEAKSNAYKIHPKRDGRLVQISGMAFLKYYNIPHDETKVYTCEWNEEEKLIEVKI